MQNDKPELSTIRQLSIVTALVRGLMATPSGNDDDPYQRVIIKCLPGIVPNHTGDSVEPPHLYVKALNAEASTEALRDQLRLAIHQYSSQHGGPPLVMILEGMGTLHILLGARAYSAVVKPMATKAGQVENKKVPAEYPLQNKVALVTGAAGAIGAGICNGLLSKGCHVAATDLIQETLDDLVNELKVTAPERVIGVRLDVTDKEDVAEGFASVIRAWGGVDIVVVNAGIAMVASLMDMDPDAFRKLEKVNVEGTLLTLAEAGRWLCLQGTGGDIIVISSKNVFAPGAQFGAYSATKAASHQLARIASLELAPFGVRVNMVSPDAVFSDGQRKSGLWAEIGPSRMRARGLDEKGLEEYYRNRNLLKARITPAHVANAVLFFATRQTPTTGATLPVDGGLPDATPR